MPSTPTSAPADLSALLNTSIKEPLPEADVQRILASQPFIPIPYSLNLRTLSSPVLRPNLVFRSGSLSHIPPSSLALLRDKYNITTIFDLTSKAEREKSPGPKIDGVKTIWIPSTRDMEFSNGENGGVETTEKSAFSALNPSNFAANDGVDGFSKMYGDVLETHKDAFRAVFEKLGENEGGTLFHCTAGKDRTGILAALILAILDTPRETIAMDYALTRVGVEPYRERLIGVLLWQLGQSPENPDLNVPGLEAMSSSRGATILALLDWMGEKWKPVNSGDGQVGLYPGVYGYLTHKLGFKSQDIEKMKENLRPQHSKS